MRTGDDDLRTCWRCSGERDEELIWLHAAVSQLRSQFNLGRNNVMVADDLFAEYDRRYPPPISAAS